MITDFGVIIHPFLEFLPENKFPATGKQDLIMAKDLNKLNTEELGQLFPVIIVDYDPYWKELYLLEKQKIIKTIGPGFISGIEHIGSTAIPGLCAKPTIDILIEITGSADLDLFISNLQKIGYQYITKPENPPPHMMFAKGYTQNGISGQTYHIHLRFTGDWDEIIFRDYLIGNPETAADYAELKRKLAVEFKNDRDKYTESKTAFIKRIINKARL